MSHPPTPMHDLLRYATPEDLVRVALPWLRAGLDAGEAVLVACAPDTAARINAGLGHDQRLLLLPQAQIYRHPSDAVTAYIRATSQALATGADRIRLLGEIDFNAARCEAAEWLRYEAAANQALAPYPIWAVCAYNTHTLPSWILTDSERTHPGVMDAEGRSASHRYLQPAVYLRSTGPDPVDAIETTTPVLHTDTMTTLATLRRDLRAALAACGHTDQSAEALVLAVNEVTTNATRHGTPPVQVRLWSTPRRSMCAVTDHGAGFDDPFAGYLDTPITATSGRGLWLARRLCHRVNIGHDPGGGFTVRLLMRH